MSSCFSFTYGLCFYVAKKKKKAPKAFGFFLCLVVDKIRQKKNAPNFNLSVFLGRRRESVGEYDRQVPKGCHRLPRNLRGPQASQRPVPLGPKSCPLKYESTERICEEGGGFDRRVGALHRRVSRVLK